MRSSRGAVIVAGLAAALAMSGSGDATRQLVHTGAGVARREAYHGRRAQERAELEEVNVEEVLADERLSDVIVRVAASTIVVEAEGPNYVPNKKRETKKQRRARQQAKAREQQQQQQAEAEAEAAGEATRTHSAAPATPVAAEVESGAGDRRVNGRLRNALCDAFEDEEDDV